MDIAQMDVEIGLKIQGVEAGLNKVQQDLAKTAVAASKVDSSFDKVSKSTNSATLAMTNLGRIVQDAPFGFLGISNNLNPMLESFQRLQKETGSAGSALKAMSSSLIGTGGIGLAISAVSSLLVVFGDKLFSSSKSTEKASIAIDAYKQSMQKAFEEAGKQVEKVSLIVAALQSENTTLAQRKKLLEELNGINNTYFGNLKLEQGAVEGLAIAYQAYADNIFKVAKAKAAEEQIGKLSTKLVSITDQMNILTEQLSGTNRALTLKDASRGVDAIKKDFEDLNKILNQDVITLKDFALISRVTGLTEQQVNEILSKRRTLRTEEARTLAQIADLSKSVAQNDLGSIVGFTNPEKVKEDIQRVMKDVGTIVTFPVTINPVIDPSMMDKIKGSLVVIQNAFQSAEEDMVSGLKDEGFKFPANFWKLSSEDRKNMEDLFTKVDEIIKNNLGDIFTRIGENLGNFQNPFAGILSIIGEGLKEIGIAVILASELLSQIKKALNAAISSPGAGALKGIALGIGLVALGTALQRIPKLAQGGIATNATLGVFGEAGPEAILPLDRLKDFMSPTSSVPIVLETRLSGSDIYLSQSREAKNRGKKY